MDDEAERLGLKQLRERLREMTDPELREYGNDLRMLHKSAHKQGLEPDTEFVIQLEEATAEWRRRRNPKTDTTK